VLLFALLGAAATGIAAPRDGAARLRHAVDWPGDCESIREHRVSAPWLHSQDDRVIECEVLGPWVRYAHFESREALESDLLAASPPAAVCLYGDGGREIAVDGLDPHRFPALCRRLHGALVDGVTGLPEPPGDGTLDGIDGAAEREIRRDARAEHRALVASFR
jgi:hypothetical protein